MKKTWMIGLISGAVLIVGAGIFWAAGRHSGSAKDNVVYVNSVESIMDSGMEGGHQNRFAGIVETQKQMDINPDSERTIKEIKVKEGQEVNVGTELFVYDTDKENETLNKASLDLERIKNNISNKKDEIEELERLKKTAGSEEQLDYTMQIQSAQMEMKQSEFEQQTKELEIEKLKDSIENASVISTMDGIVKSIHDGSGNRVNQEEGSEAFMTIIAMGDYRVKGKVNEQNAGAVMAGEKVIIRSRVDEEVIWRGTMEGVDIKKPSMGNNLYGESSDTQSSSYPFYVTLDSSQGLMLGQHVYIEPDIGQEDGPKDGIWIDMAFIADENGQQYVWADNGRGELEKRLIQTGGLDEESYQYKVIKGLNANDKITFPEDGLTEGMKTAVGSNSHMGMSNPENSDNDRMMDENMMSEENIPADDIEEEGVNP